VRVAARLGYIIWYSHMIGGLLSSNAYGEDLISEYMKKNLKGIKCLTPISFNKEKDEVIDENSILVEGKVLMKVDGGGCDSGFIHREMIVSKSYGFVKDVEYKHMVNNFTSFYVENGYDVECSYNLIVKNISKVPLIKRWSVDNGYYTGECRVLYKNNRACMFKIEKNSKLYIGSPKACHDMNIKKCIKVKSMFFSVVSDLIIKSDCIGELLRN